MLTPVDPHTCRVAVLAGGTSGEREISLASGEGASSALREAGFDVTIIDPASRKGLQSLVQDSFDVAFLCLHGKYGEDGTIQGFLETIGLPYTCSGIWSSAVAMDKVLAKQLYATVDIPTPQSVELQQYQPYDLDAIIETVGSHCVVKAPNEGSTIGIYMVETREALEEAIIEAFKLDTHIMVESFVSGREMTVAVLGNDEPFALPVIEIIPKNEFYDFESKYAPGGSEHICPARITPAETELLQELAVKAHQVLGCQGVSRSDFLLDELSRPWILETNTIPGMTRTSLLPDAAHVYGMSFPEVCTKLIEYALEAHTPVRKLYE